MSKAGLVMGIMLSTIMTSLAGCIKNSPASSRLTPVADQSFTEEFDTVASAFGRGWVTVNNSNPKGSGTWQQGGNTQPWFAPYSSKGSYAGFIGTDFQSTSGNAAVISNWLISPVIILQNGDKIIFYTRCRLIDLHNGDSTDYGNNLEVCINRKNEGTNVGTALNPRNIAYDDARDRGDFESIFQLNPPEYSPFSNFFIYRRAHSNAGLFDPLAYPAGWTRFEVSIAGLDSPRRGRFAFRYYVLDGGYNGNGSAIGIDKVSYVGKK